MSDMSSPSVRPFGARMSLYEGPVAAVDGSGMGNDTSRPSGRIGLGTPPYALSNPFREKTSRLTTATWPRDGRRLHQSSRRLPIIPKLDAFRAEVPLGSGTSGDTVRHHRGLLTSADPDRYRGKQTLTVV